MACDDATSDVTSATEVARPAQGQVASRSAFQLFWARFREDKVALFGGLVILLLVFIALFGGPIAHG